MSDKLSNILLIHTGALGDFLLTLHLVEAMRRSGAHVDYLGRSEHGQLGCEGGFLRCAYDVEGTGFHEMFGGESCSPSVAGMVAGHDLILFSSAHDRRAEIAADFAKHSGGKAIAFDPRCNETHELHITDQWRAHIEHSGLRIDVEPAKLSWPRVEIERLSQIAEWKQGRTRIIVQPGSGGVRKNWPIEMYLDVARYLMRIEQFDVCVLLGPIEIETWKPQLLDQIHRSCRCVSGLSLIECAALIASADVFIGNDSGTGHLAAAMGLKVISIFGVTSPQVWRPLGPEVHVLGEKGKWPESEEVFLKACELSAIVDR